MKMIYLTKIYGQIKMFAQHSLSQPKFIDILNEIDASNMNKLWVLMQMKSQI